MLQKQSTTKYTQGSVNYLISSKFYKSRTLKRGDSFLLTKLYPSGTSCVKAIRKCKNSSTCFTPQIEKWNKFRVVLVFFFQSNFWSSQSQFRKHFRQFWILSWKKNRVPMKPLSGAFLHGPTCFQYFNKGVLYFF